MSQGTQPTQAIEPPNLAEGTASGVFWTPSGNTDGEQRIGKCRHVAPPGADHTCPHPYHLRYSEANLPPLLFRLEPPEVTPFLSSEVPLLGEGGKPVKDYDGLYIRGFWFLPRYISKNPPAWLLEFWMRSDSRITLRDIKARMTVPKKELPSDQDLMELREGGVCRPLNLSCWGAHGWGLTSGAGLERAARLSYDQISFNTTMSIEYSRTCESIPMYLMDRSFVPFTGQRFELSTFLYGGQRQAPALHIVKCINELFNVEPRADTTDDSQGTATSEWTGSYPIQQQQNEISSGLSSDGTNIQTSHDTEYISLDNQHFEFSGGLNSDGTNMQTPRNTEYLSLDDPRFEFISPLSQSGQEITRAIQPGLKRKRLLEESMIENTPDRTTQAFPIGSQSSEGPATQTQSDTTTQAFPIGSQSSEGPATQTQSDTTTQAFPIGSQSSEGPATQTQSYTATQSSLEELRSLPGNSQFRFLAPKTSKSYVSPYQ